MNKLFTAFIAVLLLATSFAGAAGATVCTTPCSENDKGKYCETISKTCVGDCTKPTNSTFTGPGTIDGDQTSCPWTCNAGYYLSVGGDACAECPQGSYKTGPGDDCTPCAKGKTNNGPHMMVQCTMDCPNKANVAATDGWEEPKWDNQTKTLTNVCVIKTCVNDYKLVNNKCEFAGYTITFDANGGQFSTSTTDNIKEITGIPENASITTHPNTIHVPRRAGYAFTGYYKAKTGGDKFYNANKTPVNESHIWSGSITLYAQWKSCPKGYYCLGPGTETCKKGDGGKTHNGCKCPIGATSDGGAKSVGDCMIKGGKTGTKFCDNHGCFYLPEGVKVQVKHIK